MDAVAELTRMYSQRAAGSITERRQQRVFCKLIELYINELEQDIAEGPRYNPRQLIFASPDKYSRVSHV